MQIRLAFVICVQSLKNKTLFTPGSKYEINQSAEIKINMLYGLKNLLRSRIMNIKVKQ